MYVLANLSQLPRHAIFQTGITPDPKNKKSNRKLCPQVSALFSALLISAVSALLLSVSAPYLKTTRCRIPLGVGVNFFGHVLEMLEQGKQIRRERKSFRIIYKKLFALWGNHTQQISTSQLMEECAQIYTNFNAIKHSETADDARHILEHENE
jgi:hypothetical protein